MKLIRCQLDVEQLERIVNALVHLTNGMTIWEAREDSKDVNHRAVYRGREYEVSPPRFVLEIVTDDSWADDILRKLAEADKDEPIGDRKIRVFPVEASYHVRTGFVDF